MSKICLIGNSGSKAKGFDGQTTKVNIYRKKIVEEGHELLFVDLENFSSHPFRALKEIRKNTKLCDRIVLLTADRGVKILIPYINFINKGKKPFVLPMIGINILHKYVDKMSKEEQRDFFINGIIKTKPKKRDVKQLKKINYILPENDIVAEAIKKFYGINNVYILNNFRDINFKLEPKVIENGTGLKLIYVSRVSREKGIFVLIDAVKKMCEDGKDVALDIYGKTFFSNEDEIIFKQVLDKNITYCGTIDNDKVIATIKKYDCFVFPSLYFSEGTPGVISEALISGTPVISSNFIQVGCLLKNGVDSLIYDSSDSESLLRCLETIYNDKELLSLLSLNVLKSAERYTYSYNRDNFLNYVCGKINSNNI